MCTGIIFPGKCGVIEKKNENRSRVIRTLFRGGDGGTDERERERRVKERERGRRARQAIQLDTVGRERECAMIEDRRAAAQESSKFANVGGEIPTSDVSQ